MELATKKVYDIREVRDVFIASLEQVLNNAGTEQYASMMVTIVNMLGTWRPHLVLSPDELPKIAGELFQDDVKRSFFLSLKFVFFANLASGVSNNLIGSIISDLAIAMSPDMMFSAGQGEEDDPLDAMPREVKDSLVNCETAMRVMESNTWVVPIILLLVFMDLDHPLLQPKEPQKNK